MSRGSAWFEGAYFRAQQDVLLSADITYHLANRDRKIEFG
jgi:hypothetical protein